jgi:DNA polymerase I
VLDKNTLSNGVVLAEHGCDLLERFLQDPEVHLVGHNLSFDVAVALRQRPRLARLVFKAYDAGRMHDTIIREKLINNAFGQLKYTVDTNTGKAIRQSYSMQALAYQRLGLDLREEKSGPSWRMHYNRLAGVDPLQWPDDAYDYAYNDAVITAGLFIDQMNAPPTEYGPTVYEDGTVLDEANNTRADLWLHLSSVSGVRTDGERVSALRVDLQRQLDDVRSLMVESGIERPDGSCDTKVLQQRVEDAFSQIGEEPPTTPSGKPSTAATVLEQVAHVDPVLKARAEVASVSKLLTSFVPMLEHGTVHPINPRYDVLKDTGRTSCWGFNVQQLPRLGGVRECIRAPEGFWLASTDYDTLEMRTLAQTCLDWFGWSHMADALNKGRDLHTDFAAQLLGIGYEEIQRRLAAGDAEAAEMRRLAKVANFGFPGGLGAAGFVAYASGFGVEVDSAQAFSLRNHWMRRWAEMDLVFQEVAELCGFSGRCSIELPVSRRVRGDASFTSACNFIFQGPASTGAKNAGWLLTRDMYTRPDSPLWGCRIVAFVHDEYVYTVPADRARATAAIDRADALIREGMEMVVRDVPVACSGALMGKHWYKDAKRVIGSDGLLEPWDQR